MTEAQKVDAASSRVPRIFTNATPTRQDAASTLKASTFCASAMDTIRIQGLRCRARVGVASWERKEGCGCEIDLEIGRDLEPAAWSDNLENTLDYLSASREVVALAENTHCHLLETLAGKICAHLLAKPNVEEVRVVLKKKEIVGGPTMDFAAVDIVRKTERKK